MGVTTQVLTRGLAGLVPALQPLHRATESTLGCSTRPDRCGRTPECHDWACPGLCLVGNLEVGSTGLAVPARLSGTKTATLPSLKLKLRSGLSPIGRSSQRLSVGRSA